VAAAAGNFSAAADFGKPVLAFWKILEPKKFFAGRGLEFWNLRFLQKSFSAGCSKLIKLTGVRETAIQQWETGRRPTLFVFWGWG
jgi:hypothetical protein